MDGDFDDLEEIISMSSEDSANMEASEECIFSNDESVATEFLMKRTNICSDRLTTQNLRSTLFSQNVAEYKKISDHQRMYATNLWKFSVVEQPVQEFESIDISSSKSSYDRD